MAEDYSWIKKGAQAILNEKDEQERVEITRDPDNFDKSHNLIGVRYLNKPMEGGAKMSNLRPVVS